MLWMDSRVTSKNAKWCHLIWPTLYRVGQIVRPLGIPDAKLDTTFEVSSSRIARIARPSVRLFVRRVDHRTRSQAVARIAANRTAPQ